MDALAGLRQDVLDMLPPTSTALPAATSRCLWPQNVQVGCCGSGARPQGTSVHGSASRRQILAVCCALSMGCNLQMAPSPRRWTGC